MTVYKVLNEDGTSYHGGDYRWSLPTRNAAVKNIARAACVDWDAANAAWDAVRVNNVDRIAWESAWVAAEKVWVAAEKAARKAQIAKLLEMIR